jgi:hypothetical protein
MFRPNVDMIEQMAGHVRVIAVGVLRRKAEILIQIERHDAGEIEPLLAVEPDELAI